MGLSKTKKVIIRLKERAENTIHVSKLGILPNSSISEDIVQDAVEVANDTIALINAYEEQIELNKKQNIKIKNQRGILKILQRKQGGEV